MQSMLMGNGHDYHIVIIMRTTLAMRDRDRDRDRGRERGPFSLAFPFFDFVSSTHFGAHIILVCMVANAF